ncbi:hypothetical protein HOV93_29720 [Planctomycetes bacterium FF15]|uniref:Uncharacterized protein n=1 Tax=Bremerella alba TaxID=980252 RepID=A0A7V9A7W2_9BACT|nr:hypothetical protein [Bremerella alba]
MDLNSGIPVTIRFRVPLASPFEAQNMNKRVPASHSQKAWKLQANRNDAGPRNIAGDIISEECEQWREAERTASKCDLH